MYDVINNVKKLPDDLRNNYYFCSADLAHEGDGAGISYINPITGAAVEPVTALEACAIKEAESKPEYLDNLQLVIGGQSDLAAIEIDIHKFQGCGHNLHEIPDLMDKPLALQSPDKSLLILLFKVSDHNFDVKQYSACNEALGVKWYHGKMRPGFVGVAGCRKSKCCSLEYRNEQFHDFLNWLMEHQRNESMSCSTSTFGEYEVPENTFARMSEEEFKSIEQSDPSLCSSKPNGTQEAKPNEKKEEFRCYTAKELVNMEFDPLEWIVDNMLYPGLAVLAAPAKYGKSWFALQLGMAVAQGEPFLGFRTIKCRAWYLALEDTPRRGRDRLLMQNNMDDEVPDTLNVQFKTGSLNTSLLENLENKLKEPNAPRLIIIDTLAKVRDLGAPNRNVYLVDYEELSKLKNLADTYNVCILVITHTRKLIDPRDPFNQIMGSTAVQGVVDCAMVMMREDRSDTQTTLHITGRDLEETAYVISLKKDNCTWTMIGAADEIAAKEECAAYERDPFVHAVKKLLDQNRDVWEGTSKELNDALGSFGERYAFDKPKKCGHVLKLKESQLWKYDGIQVTNTGRKKANTIIWRIERNREAKSTNVAS